MSFLPYVPHNFLGQGWGRSDVMPSVWWGPQFDLFVESRHFSISFTFPRCLDGKGKGGKGVVGRRGKHRYSFHVVSTLPGSLVDWSMLLSSLILQDEKGRKLSGNVHSCLFLGNHWKWYTSGLWIPPQPHQWGWFDQ